MRFAIKSEGLPVIDMLGSGEEPNVELIKRARKGFLELFLIAGGGVRYPYHLEQLNAAGADAVLVATSFHNGWVGRYSEP